MALSSQNQSVILHSGEHLIAHSGEPIVNVTAFTARQKVSGYVGDQISHMMGGGDPTLILTNDTLVWRVPIVLTMPSRGAVGMVGFLDVNARTGSLIVPSYFIEQVEARAQEIVAPA